MNKAIRYFTFFALSTIHAYAIGADLLTSIEADSRKANQDCVSSIDANATVSKLDEKLTSQNRESICLNKVPTNSNDKVQTQAEAKSFCMCIEQHLKKPIGHRRLTYIDSMIKASAEKTKAVYYMEKILSSRLLVKNLLESSMAKSYLKSDSSFDTASTCSMQYLKASLAKAMDKEVTGCTYEKVDKVINSIREDPHIKADHTLNKSLNKLPKNTKKLLEGVEADVERYAGWDEKLLNAFKQMMSLYSLEKDGKIASARADIETRANMIESVTVILSESSVLNDIKLTFPSGGVINPEGSTDITEYLAADVTNRQMMLTGDKLYATAATHQALADAFRKASLKNTLENTITKAKCDDIVADYTEMCNAFDNDDRFQHQVLAEDLLRSSGPIPSDHIVVPDDINAVGAIQCYMAGLSHSTLDSKAKAYAELNMTELMAVEANLGVGVHLRNPKRYLDMLNKGINKAPGAASGSVDMKALTERFNKAEEREKVFGKRLQGVNFGNLINEKGEATYENSTFADPTPDHTPPFVTPLNKPSEIL
ncbi:MAG: hypothetical protein KAG61_13090, partial [Bacteriovoracaceae bacterium]|nr:hypothetical protein [Bacteriovoracaceae bacterium]